MNNSRQKRLDKAQLKVLFQVPFFAPGVAKLPVEFVAELDYEKRFGVEGQKPTACTDGEKLYWCAEWFDTLPDQVLVTLLAHEVCHCLLGHIWRLPPPGGDHQVANQAADHAVNLMLKDFGALVTAKRLADPFPFPADAPGLCDPQYAGMSEEAIYAKLISSRQGGRQGGAQPGQGAKAMGGGLTNGAGRGKNAPTGNVGSNNARQNLPSFGQFKPKSGGAAGQAAAKKLKNDWEGTLIQSVAAMKGRGDLPAGLDRLVNNLVSPQVNWWDVLRSWLREQCADDYDWQTPCMEYSDGDFILPSLKSERMTGVVFALDTSGSITPELLTIFRSEEQDCLDQMRPKTLVEICCDAKVQQVTEYSVGDTIGGPAPGGGGTVFSGIWDHVLKMPVQPKCIVVLTDCCADFGKDPGIPVIFVSWEKDAKAPFGKVIYAGK